MGSRAERYLCTHLIDELGLSSRVYVCMQIYGALIRSQMIKRSGCSKGDADLDYYEICGTHETKLL